MKLIIKAVILTIFSVTLTCTVLAQTPAEQLSQMVAQLKKTPNDAALRQKIIKLAVTAKPALPEEAERRMARGAAAFKGAKSVSDYQDAIKEYQAAVDAAPWYADAYFNLGVAQDKAEKYADALQSLKWAQMASPDAKDIKALMYEVEYRNEKSAPSAQAEREKQQFRELVKTNDGALFVESWQSRAENARFRWKAKVQGQQVAFGVERIDASGRIFEPEVVLGEQFSYARSHDAEVLTVNSQNFVLQKKAGCWNGTRTVETDRAVSIDKTWSTITVKVCEDIHVLKRQ